MQTFEADAWLRVIDVARKFGVSAATVRNLIRDGKLAAVRHGDSDRAMYLVRQSVCDAYLASREVTAA